MSENVLEKGNVTDGGVGVYSGNIMLDEQDVVIPSGEFHKDPSEFAKIAQKAMKGTDFCKEVVA